MENLLKNAKLREWPEASGNQSQPKDTSKYDSFLVQVEFPTWQETQDFINAVQGVKTCN